MDLKQSYRHGASSAPLIGQTIGSFLSTISEKHGDREALVVPFQNVRMTYRELYREAERFAAGLKKMGLQPGDRIAILSQNNAEWVIAQFGTAIAGLILITVNPSYRLSELEHALSKSGCRAIIATPSLKTTNFMEMLERLAPQLFKLDSNEEASRLPSLEFLIVIGGDQNKSKVGVPFYDVARTAGDEDLTSLRKQCADLQFDDPINVQFTSGTTGLPKGATLTHHGILNSGFFVGERMGFTERDRLCIPLPLFHTFGMVLGVLACVTHGATVVLPGELFDALEVLKVVESEKCTALHGVPTMFIAELEHPRFKEFDLSSLRTGMMAGAPCPLELMQRVTTEMQLTEITIGFGMTEASPTVTQTDKDDPIERRVGTVGRVAPHVEIKIVDNAGRVVPPGQSGELLARGYNIMRGYWNDDAQTDAAIDSAGWMHTGDLAVMDEDGYFQIVGRIKDMVIRGGENIYPAEIEAFLYKNPKVETVQVFGVPDQKYGEELCAWISLKAGQTSSEEEMRDFCKGQIAHYKIPKLVVFVDSFPMTATGKIQKFAMRDTMIERMK